MLKGFIVGLALTIIAGQLPKLFGVDKGDGDFFEQMWDLLGNLGDTSAATLAIGLGSLLLVLGLRRFAPVVPGSLVAVAVGVVIVELASPDGVDIVGTIDSGLPPVGLPDACLPHRRGRGQPSPVIPSPISFAPMTRQSTAMIAVLLAPIHAFISSSRCVARSPSAK